MQHTVNYFLELIHKITNLALDKFHFDLDNLPKTKCIAPYFPDTAADFKADHVPWCRPIECTYQFDTGLGKKAMFLLRRDHGSCAISSI